MRARRFGPLLLLLLAPLALADVPYSSGAGQGQLLVEQNAPNRFVKKISITTTAAITAIGTTTNDDYTYGIVPGSLIAVQSDVDFFFELRKPGSTTAVTNLAGARPGTKVFAGQVYFAYIGADTLIDLVAASSSGTVVLFLVKP